MSALIKEKINEDWSPEHLCDVSAAENYENPMMVSIKAKESVKVRFKFPVDTIQYERESHELQYQTDIFNTNAYNMDEWEKRDMDRVNSRPNETFVRCENMADSLSHIQPYDSLRNDAYAQRRFQVLPTSLKKSTASCVRGLNNDMLTNSCPTLIGCGIRTETTPVIRDPLPGGHKFSPQRIRNWSLRTLTRSATLPDIQRDRTLTRMQQKYWDAQPHVRRSPQTRVVVGGTVAETDVIHLKSGQYNPSNHRKLFVQEKEQSPQDPMVAFRKEQFRLKKREDRERTSDVSFGRRMTGLASGKGPQTENMTVPDGHNFGITLSGGSKPLHNRNHIICVQNRYN